MPIRILLTVVAYCFFATGVVLAQSATPPTAKQAAPAAQPAAPPAPTLDEMIAQLRTNPGDDALRERLIERVAKMRTKPAIPEDARRAFVQGNAAFTAAQGPADYQRAADRFNEALTLAPWWGDVYFNQSKVREQQGNFDLAIKNLKNYLRSAPPASDARTAQDQIYVLEEKKAAAAQRRTDEAARRAREGADREAAVWAAIDGARYVCPTQIVHGLNTQATITVSGRTITKRVRFWDHRGDMTPRPSTMIVTGISGGEVQLDRGQRVGPSSAVSEGPGDGRGGGPGLVTCPRQ